MHNRVHKKTLRRHTIAGMATLGIAALVLTGCGSDNGDYDAQGPPHQTFVSRPDLQPVELQLTEGEAWSAEYAESDEYVFLTTEFDTATPASAAMIVDATGELVWMDPVKQHINDHGYFDLRVQEYRDEPVLTYFKGPAALGWGYGDIYVMDRNYNVLTAVTTSGSMPAHETDFHDAVITEDDTMLVMAYVATQTDLSEVGGEEDGWVHDGVVQEVDIETGEVLFESTLR